MRTKTKGDHNLKENISNGLGILRITCLLLAILCHHGLIVSETTSVYKEILGLCKPTHNPCNSVTCGAMSVRISKEHTVIHQNIINWIQHSNPSIIKRKMQPNMALCGLHACNFVVSCRIPELECHRSVATR
jgi:hypothetical protein